jgi:hypothetical protein
MKLAPLVLLVAIALMIFGTGRGASTANAQPVAFDPACLAACQFAHLQCFVAASRNSEQKKCLAEYKHCITRCK